VAEGPPLSLSLELEFDPAKTRLLLRRFAPLEPRARPLSCRWHDTAEAELAARGLALLERRQGGIALWRLERLPAAGNGAWPCGTPAPAVAEAADRTQLGHLPQAPLLARTRFRGRTRALLAGEGPLAPRLTLLQGRLAAEPGERAVTRLQLAGSPPAVTGLALDLAQELGAAVASSSLSAEACALAGGAVPPLPLGAPELPPRLSVGAAFAFVCAHLARVLLHYAPLAANQDGTEPVHQIRVAVRRLRSAVALFRRAVACPELDAVKAGLRTLARTLGPARDWDVFVTETGEAVAAAFPDDAAVARLLAAAARRRDACYAELRRVLADAEFRRLGIALATVAAARPWEAAAADGDATRQADALAAELHAFAAQALSRRLRHLTEQGDEIAALPNETLHAIRLRAKRLRYGVEMLAPLYPHRHARRYIRRLANLQDWLGHLNDGNVAAALMAELQGSGGRGFAAGVVCGFVAAGAGDARVEIARCWQKFHRLQPFWT